MAERILSFHLRTNCLSRSYLTISLLTSKSQYTKQEIEPFSDQMVAEIGNDFLEYIQDNLRIKAKVVTIRYVLDKTLPRQEETSYVCYGRSLIKIS